MAGVENRVAFVTGAASGIGQAVARRLSEAGAKVAVADVNDVGRHETLDSLTNAGVFVHVDVTDSASVRAGADEATRQLGPVDILVNVAGTDIVKPFLDTDEKLWDFLIQLNLMGVFRTTQALLPGMVERGYGRLVNVASDAGRVGSSGEAVYSGAKGGVIAFTKTIAREVARHQITANTLCPGPTETPPLKKMVSEGGEGYIKAMVRGIPLGRLGQPEDLGTAALFFASDAASYITGQTLSVSGGMSMV